jgi:hypothetical protein
MNSGLCVRCLNYILLIVCRPLNFNCAEKLFECILSVCSFLIPGLWDFNVMIFVTMKHTHFCMPALTKQTTVETGVVRRQIRNLILFIPCIVDNHITQYSVLYFSSGARGGTVSWGTALQTGRWRFRFPMVSLEFFIDVIFSVALWPWGRLSL